MNIDRDFRIRMVAVALGCGSLAAGPASAETWNCMSFDRFGSATGDELIVATTGETDGIGSIVVAGKTYSARYEVVGINRVWLWAGAPGGTSQYALRIQPNGNGASFDLGVVEDDEIAPAAQLFICEPN